MTVAPRPCPFALTLLNAQFVCDLRFRFGPATVEKYHSTDVVVDGLTQLLGVLQEVGGISDVDESDGDRLDMVVDDLSQPTRSADFRTKPVLHLSEIIAENYVTGTIFGWEAAYDDVTSTCLLRQHLAVNRGEHCPLYGFLKKGYRFVNYNSCKGTTDG